MRVVHVETHMLDTIIQDLRYALRALRSTPGFAAVAILSLALGIGANTAIFSLIDSVMLKTLPVSHPEQLLQVRTPAGFDDVFTNPTLGADPRPSGCIFNPLCLQPDALQSLRPVGKFATLREAGSADSISKRSVSTRCSEERSPPKTINEDAPEQPF